MRVTACISKLFVGLVAIFVSCGRPIHNPSDLASFSPRGLGKDLTIFFSGGFNSCVDTEFVRSIVPTLQMIRSTGRSVRYVGACHDKLGTIHFQPSDGESKTGTIKDVIAAVSGEADQTKSREVVLIGHSYGGWLSMTVAYGLSRRYEVRGLISIDPMSPKYCYPAVVSKGFLSQAAGFEAHPGCLGAPPDYTLARRRVLLNKVGFWMNFYQTVDANIHSGGLHPAEDIPILYQWEDRLYTLAHRKIDTDRRVWSQIEVRLRSLL